MKSMVHIFLAFSLITLFVGCAHPVRDRGLECEVTCLDGNMLDKDIVRIGCTCEEKEDPNRRKYENINLEPNNF